MNLVETRADTGALWENFWMAERLKTLAYSKSDARMYFWRTVRQQEVDYVEEEAGIVKGYGFKYNPKAKVKTPKVFEEAYEKKVQIVNTGNFREFVEN